MAAVPFLAAAPILTVRDLDVRYGRAAALSSISLELHEAMTLTILGSNGAGKSTFARACSGLVPPAAGRIEFDSVNITGWGAHRIRQAGLVYLPEGRGVFPSLSVMENLRVAVKLVEGGGRARSAAIDKAISIFPVLGERRGQRAGSLSGGEQQMLALARVLPTNPKLVIVDEPSLGLSPRLVDQVFESLQKVRDSGVAMILIEQFVKKALGISDECVILRRGTVAWSGGAGEAAAEVVEQYLGASAEGGDG
jgi:branched-chain amino acid transport system ATP-binding protein